MPLRAPPLGIDPNRLYTKEGVRLECGLGKQWLNEARQAGLTHIEEGKRIFIRGRDLIQWIESQAK